MAGLNIPILKNLKVGGDKGFMGFIKSNEVIAVASAILITPVIMASITAIISKVPLLRDHFAIGMLVASFIIFALSAMMTGMLRAVLLGISAGVLIVGLQSTSIVQGFLGKLEEVVP